MRESNPQHSCVYLALQPTELRPPPDRARPSPDWATAVTRLSSGRHPYWATAVTRSELRLNFIEGFLENNLMKILKIFFLTCKVCDFWRRFYGIWSSSVICVLQNVELLWKHLSLSPFHLFRSVSLGLFHENRVQNSKMFHEMAFIVLSKTLALTTLPLHIKMRPSRPPNSAKEIRAPLPPHSFFTSFTSSVGIEILEGPGLQQTSRPTIM